MLGRRQRAAEQIAREIVEVVAIHRDHQFRSICLIKALGSSMKAPAVRRAAANAGKLDAVFDELRAHGRNLNQMTRHANTAGSLVSLGADIKAMLTQTETMISLVLDALRVEEDA